MAKDDSLLQVENLAAKRGGRLLFRDFNLQLNPGELLHLKGTNGSGKTTLLQLLVGLAVPAAGRVLWPKTSDNRRSFCYLGHGNAHKLLLTARENLLLPACGTPVSASEADRVLELLGLERTADLPLIALSAGQQRQLALARLLLHRATTWLLDEPFSALDQTAREFWYSKCTEFCAQGGAVLLTGHGESIANARPLELTVA